MARTPLRRELLVAAWVLAGALLVTAVGGVIALMCASASHLNLGTGPG